MFQNLVSSLVLAGEVNITAFPTRLNSVLMLNNMWIAELIASLFLIMVVLLVFTFAGSVPIGLIAGTLMMCFCTAIQWLDGWILILISMMVASFFTTTAFKKLLGS